MERNEAVDLLGYDLIDPLQGHAILIQRQAVEIRPMLGGKTLQLVQSILLLENRRIAFQRVGRVEDSGAAAGRFLG